MNIFFFISRSGSLHHPPPPPPLFHIPHSHLPLFSSLTGDGIFPLGPQTKCDNTAIMLLTYGSRCLSHNVHTVVTTICKWHTISNECNIFNSFAMMKYEQQQLLMCEEEENIFVRLVFLFVIPFFSNCLGIPKHCKKK